MNSSSDLCLEKFNAICTEITNEAYMQCIQIHCTVGHKIESNDMSTLVLIHTLSKYLFKIESLAKIFCDAHFVDETEFHWMEWDNF